MRTKNRYEVYDIKTDTYLTGDYRPKELIEIFGREINPFDASKKGRRIDRRYLVHLAPDIEITHLSDADWANDWDKTREMVMMTLKRKAKEVK